MWNLHFWSSADSPVSPPHIRYRSLQLWELSIRKLSQKRASELFITPYSSPAPQVYQRFGSVLNLKCDSDISPTHSYCNFYGGLKRLKSNLKFRPQFHVVLSFRNEATDLKIKTCIWVCWWLSCVPSKFDVQSVNQLRTPPKTWARDVKSQITQQCIGRLCRVWHMVSYGSPRAVELLCNNPLPVKSKMLVGCQILVVSTV